MLARIVSFAAMAVVSLAAQDPSAEKPAKTFLIDTGTRIPLTMINSVSTKHTAPGDRVYLETSFPIVVDGHIVIPAGSYVIGTITNSRRPGKVKGRGEFYLRFDALTLPNGTTRDFRATISGLDGRASEDLDKAEGKVSSEGNKSGDAITVAGAATTGATVGGLAGLAGGSPGMGAGIGAAAGATAGLVAVLLSRGPDAVLAKGTTVEMVLDRQLKYDENEIDFSKAAPQRSSASDSSGPMPSRKQGSTFPRRF